MANATADQCPPGDQHDSARGLELLDQNRQPTAHNDAAHVDVAIAFLPSSEPFSQDLLCRGFDGRPAKTGELEQSGISPGMRDDQGGDRVITTATLTRNTQKEHPRPLRPGVFRWGGLPAAGSGSERLGRQRSLGQYARVWQL